ncbi:MAG: Rossmann-like and DUF2520 domain-containing protein [Clostridium sp.]
MNLGRYFTHKGIEISGFYGKNIENIKKASIVTNSKYYDNYKDLIEDSDILFITTPDDIISTIDREISKYNLNNKSVCHVSGSLQSNVLSNAKLSGALIYSIHPMFAFSNKNIPLEELEKIYFSIEGDLDIGNNNTLPVISLMNSIGNKYFKRDIKDSAVYHLANVFVSNLVLSLLEKGVSYLKKLGLNESDAINALFPLIQGNIDSIHKNGFVNSLTGPVVRGDINTIKKHLEVLNDEDRNIYNSLSLNLLKLSQNQKLNLSEDKENKNSIGKKQTSNDFQCLSKKYSEISKLLGGAE